ncbi:MAG TPA: hypothetical protein VNC50_17125, partial [Planctomycetia bacterium]|nr:hypothetical protein [Planctomycetia bacterium]
MPRAAAFSLLLVASLGAAYLFVPSPAPAPAARATAAAPVSGPDPFLADLKPALPAKPSARPAPSPQSDWPALYGPTRDGVVAETDLRLDWPASGPPEIWRKTVGVGYSQICVAGDKLLLFHRLGDSEILDCLKASD